MVVKWNFFNQFLGKLKIPKRHFEINWPLQVLWNVNGPQCTSKQFLSTRLINLDGAASQSISATHNKRHLKIEPLCFSSLLHNWWLAGSKIKLQNLNANCRAASMSVIFSYSCTVDSQGNRLFALLRLFFFSFWN